MLSKTEETVRKVLLVCGVGIVVLMGVRGVMQTMAPVEEPWPTEIGEEKAAGSYCAKEGKEDVYLERDLYMIDAYLDFLQWCEDRGGEMRYKPRVSPQTAPEKSCNVADGICG